MFKIIPKETMTILSIYIYIDRADRYLKALKGNHALSDRGGTMPRLAGMTWPGAYFGAVGAAGLSSDLYTVKNQIVARSLGVLCTYQSL